MPGPPDERPVSLGEILQAAEARDVAAFVERLTQQQNWEAIAFLFKVASKAQGNPRINVGDLTAAAQAFRDRAQASRRSKRDSTGAPDADLRACRLAAAEALLAFARRPLETEIDRRATRLAATLLFDAGDHGRAAPLFEELGDDPRAADAFGAMGDIDRMEEALARVDARQNAQRSAVDAMRRFETLLGAGERLAAVAAAAAIAEGAPEAATAHELARTLDSRLCRQGGVTLRLDDGRALRFAALPALLGRDPGAAVPLRDPGVSRRHATIRRRGDGQLVIEDAGSRAGVRLAGALLSTALPLHGEGELWLGPTCALHFTVAPDGGTALLRGAAGLDRTLLAIIGDGDRPLPLDALVPGATGLSLSFDTGVARLKRTADVAVRVAGQLIGGACDLLHGDLIEVRAAASAGRAEAWALRLEVC